MIRKSFKFVLILFAWSFPAMAAEPYGPTEQETKLLPAYCRGDAYWKSVLGPEITWNNHTCYGINRLNRYYKSTSARGKRAQLVAALSDFNYSIGHLKPEFKLMPEIYFYRGTTYKLLARNGEAVGDFLKAISLDPKLAKAYSEVADIYASKLSRRDKALEMATEGLRHNPDSKGLKRRYTELGGKLPYPEPIQPAPVVTPQPVEPEETLPAVPADTQAEAARAAPAAAPEFAEQPKIGSPTNPYCRFCPEPDPPAQTVTPEK